MAFASRTRLLFLVILLQWPLQLLFVVHACEQCEIDAAESQADGAVAGCVDAWDECDDPKTPQVEGCEGNPPEFLCPALLDSGLCDWVFHRTGRVVPTGRSMWKLARFGGVAIAKARSGAEASVAGPRQAADSDDVAASMMQMAGGDARAVGVGAGERRR